MSSSTINKISALPFILLLAGNRPDLFDWGLSFWAILGISVVAYVLFKFLLMGFSEKSKEEQSEK